MKISIITVVWNNASVIRNAINSVLKQRYPNIEYIIIDGASKDGTIQVIQSYGNQISKFVSEPDQGIYDAMNKGIKMANGDIIGILNSDDFYIDEFVIAKVINVFKEKNVDSLFADVVYVKPYNLEKVVRYYDSSLCLPENFKKAMYPAHPTFFVKREIYTKYGYFKIDYKIAADFDLMARFLYTHKISYAYLPEAIIKMRVGGVSTSFKSVYINTLEQLRVCRENGIKTNLWQILLKYPSKVVGLIRK